MSRKGGRKVNWGIPDYWQSAQYNSILFQNYVNQILELAVSRFKWINLPPTCDARYLEMTLATQGVATIAFPQRMPSLVVSTGVCGVDRPNVYDNPIKWVSQGNNSWRFNVKGGIKGNGVLVYDNKTRYPLMQTIYLWARELVDIRRTQQQNRMHQRIPFILTGLQEQTFDMTNLMKQIAGYEMAIITTKGIETITPTVLSTDVEFLGKELYEQEMNAWNQIYTALGIANLPFKAERNVEGEVRTYEQPAGLHALSAIEERRAACEKFNKFYAEKCGLTEPISVVWNQDNQSDNYNAVHNIEKWSRVEKGEGGM